MTAFASDGEGMEGNLHAFFNAPGMLARWRTHGIQQRDAYAGTFQTPQKQTPPKRGLSSVNRARPGS
jgi:hypothetical protein